MKKYKLIPWREVQKKYMTEKEIRYMNKKVEEKLALRSLRDTREELGITQEELALKSSIPRTTISKIENGKRNTSIYKLIQIANALGKDLQISFVDKKSKED